MLEWVWSAICSQPMMVDSLNPPCLWSALCMCVCVSWRRTGGSHGEAGHQLLSSPLLALLLSDSAGHCWLMRADPFHFYVYWLFCLSWHRATYTNSLSTSAVSHLLSVMLTIKEKKTLFVTASWSGRIIHFCFLDSKIRPRLHNNSFRMKCRSIVAFRPLVYTETLF